MESEILQDSLESKETKQKVPTELLPIDFELPICDCKDYLTRSHGFVLWKEVKGAWKSRNGK